MPDEFKVVYPKNVQISVSEIYNRGRKVGMETEVINAARLIDEQLRSQPREFGDPSGTLANMQLDTFSRAVTPLMVYFSVHQTKRIVFVSKIIVFPSAGL